jgi:hypothetical protein
MFSLPDYIVGTHDRYKDDVIRLTTWIIRTAASLGEDVILVHREIKILDIPLKTFVKAYNIIEKTDILMPRSIQAVTERIVAVRKHCMEENQWFDLKGEFHSIGAPNTFLHYILAIENHFRKKAEASEKDTTSRKDAFMSYG